MKTTTKLWIGMGILILLSPLGLILPEHFKAGDAWGEWGTDTVEELVGYLPQGLAKLSGLWRAPIPDYALEGWQEKGITQLSLVYILSAFFGVLIVAALSLIIAKILALSRR